MLTSSFLKYYEHCGILDPHVAPNGYRFYEGRHISQVWECIKLRNLGYSANEVKDMINAPYSAMLEDLEHKRGELERQICYLKHTQAYMKKVCAEERYYHKEPCWTVDEHGDFYYLEQMYNGGFTEDERTDALTQMWNQWIPVVRVTACIQRGEMGEPRISWGLSMPATFAKAMDLAFEKPVIHVPAMRCLEVFERRIIDNRLNDRGPEGVFSAMFARTEQILRQYHFTLVGPSYFFVRAKLMEDGRRVTYQKVLTPIL